MPKLKTHEEAYLLGFCFTDTEFPFISEEFLPDFIRGYFDNRGNVARIKNNRLNTIFVCENRDFINVLWEKLKLYAGVEKGSYDSSSYTLKFGKRDSLKIGEFMYKNDPKLFLKRKRKKFSLEV